LHTEFSEIKIFASGAYNYQPPKQFTSLSNLERQPHTGTCALLLTGLQSTTPSIPNTSFMTIDLNLLPEGDREAIPDLNEVVGEEEESAASGEQEAVGHGGQGLQHFDLNGEPDMFEEFDQGMD
jgi:hypothetical protein